MNSMDTIPTPLSELLLAGCFHLRLPVHPDNRGCFVKTFIASELKVAGLPSQFEEDFFSVSHANVIRGFHVTIPPHHGAKFIYIIQGQILDAILDLRPTSPTFGKFQCLDLDAQRGEALIIPPGVAHAFLAFGETTIVGYKMEHAYDPACDVGVRWDSTPVRWPIAHPILSPRDRTLPSLDRFNNPFS